MKRRRWWLLVLALQGTAAACIETTEVSVVHCPRGDTIQVADSTIVCDELEGAP